MTYGERFDEISRRMDAAYAARAEHKMFSPEWEAANEGIEAVYADLRVINAELAAR